jgi:DNA-binding transcriptional MerR regulator
LQSRLQNNGVALPPAEQVSGQNPHCTYGDVAVRKLIFVRRSRAFGFIIEGCSEVLGLYQDQDRTSSEVKRIVSKQLEEVQENQQEL